MQTPPPQQPHTVPAGPPGIRAEADEETAHRVQRYPGPQRGDGYCYVVRDGYEAARAWSDDKKRRDEESSLRDELTGALAEESARPVTDRRSDRDRSRARRDR